MKKLTVVLGTYNRLPQLQRCVQSVFDHGPTETVVHVTDAGSTDGTVEWLRETASSRLVPHLVGKKLGQARALNDVFAHLDSTYTAWISDDNEIVEKGLVKSCAILDANPGIGMVGLKVKDVQGPFVDAPYIGGISTAGILNVNQGLLRTEVLQSVGGFTEEFVDYGIDPDLTAKVLFAGQTIVYTKDVVIHHYREWAEQGDEVGQKVLQEKHDRYYRLYDERFRKSDGEDLFWLKRRDFWESQRGRLDQSSWLQGERAFTGMNARDWMNVLRGRYIRLWDCWLTRHRSFHLVQNLRHSPGEVPRGDPRNLHFSNPTENP